MKIKFLKTYPFTRACQCERLHCHGGEACRHYTHNFYRVGDFAVLALCADCLAAYLKGNCNDRSKN